MIIVDGTLRHLRFVKITFRNFLSIEHYTVYIE